MLTALTLLAFAIPGLLLALQGQILVTPDPSTAVTTVVTDPFTTITISGIATWLIQQAKESAWFPFLTENSTAFWQRAVGILIAAVSAFGITYTFDAAAGQLVVNGLTGSAMGAAFWEFVKQFTMQQGWYHAVVKPEAQRTAVLDSTGFRR